MYVMTTHTHTHTHTYTHTHSLDKISKLSKSPWKLTEHKLQNENNNAEEALFAESEYDNTHTTLQDDQFQQETKDKE